jgi:CubicO group peptidase (beta-lactamase class C family)
MYLPDRWYWERRGPQDVGIDADALTDAISFSQANEGTDAPYRLAELYERNQAENPYEGAMGPYKDRGPTNGLILRHGYLVAEWGDTTRVDMTFSAAKSYLATMVGLAWDAGLIHDLHDPVVQYVVDGTFDDERHRRITWHHLLQQTSDWYGELWTKPDWGDRPEGRAVAEWSGRPLHEPGSHYEYNDVRVNLAAYAALLVWRTPLPVVLRDRIMDPIGASRTWEWHGYDTSWVRVDGLMMQSVSGGGHWGGGVWASTRDHARFGLLHLRRGRWGERQLLSERWIEAVLTPGDAEPTYGYMWWLNPGRALWPSAPESAFSAIGLGSNYIWIDPEHDLVAVVRWTDSEQFDGFLQRLLAAVRS